MSAFLAEVKGYHRAEIPRLAPHEGLIAFRSGSQSPARLFSSSTRRVETQRWHQPFGRAAVGFRPRLPCRALQSYTTGAKDVWSLVSIAQTLVPEVTSV